MASAPPTIPASAQRPPSRAASVLQALARAYFARERQRLGIDAEEREAQAASTTDLVKRAQLARLAQEMELAPAEAGLRTRLIEAQIRNYDEPNRLAAEPKPGTPHYSTNEAGEVTATIPQPDGTFKQVQLGRIGQRPADIRPDAGGGGGTDVGLAANPMIVTDASGKQRLAVRVKGGGMKFLDEIDGVAVGPGPTAEMRNTEYQGGAVEPAFTLVRASLDNFEQAASGGLPGAPSAMIPGTDAYYAKSRFVDQAKALLGAIVARQAGEGSRLSDEDRRSYSQAAALVNGALMLPGGIEEARTRIDQAERLLTEVQRRRSMTGQRQELANPGGAGAAPGGAPNTRVINGVTYVKVQGGWKRQ